MPQYYVSPELLDSALQAIESWSSKVVRQRSRHVWSLLPLKVLGAMPGQPLAYAEQNDREFMDRFLYVRDDSSYPYFDPFSRQWLPIGYFHSNMATMRKNRFARQWGACEWEGDALRLAPDYADIFVDKVLTKGGEVARIPALPCAVWFFKRPSTEWPDDPDFADGVPPDAAAAVAMFRKKFHFEEDLAWADIFDANPAVLPDYAALLRVTP
jgi:5-methylcytosine-specific restriction protein B